MFNLSKTALFCLLLLWMPTLWAADSGWLVSPQNSHAKVRILMPNPQRAVQPACYFPFNWRKAGKPTGAHRVKGALHRPLPGAHLLTR